MKNSGLKRTLGLAALVAATNLGSFLGGRYLVPREPERKTQQIFFMNGFEEKLDTCGFKYYSIVGGKYKLNATIICDMRNVILDYEFPLEMDLVGYMLKKNRIVSERVYAFVTREAKEELEKDEFYLGSFSSDIGEYEYRVIDGAEDRERIDDYLFLIEKYKQNPAQMPGIYKGLRIESVIKY